MILENNDENNNNWTSNVASNFILYATSNIVPAFINPLALVLSATVSLVLVYKNLCDLEKHQTTDQNDNNKKINLWLSRVGGTAFGISLAIFMIDTGIIDHLKTTSTLTPINNVTELANPGHTVSLVSLVSQPLRQLS